MSAPVTPSSTDSRVRTGRIAVWIAIGVAVVWLVIGSVAGPLAGKLSEVQKNDNASFLPASAESTLVADEQAKFSDSTTIPALIVVTSPDGAKLDGTDMAAIGSFIEQAPTIPIEPGKTLADFADVTAIAPIPSQDGMAVLISIPLDSDAASEKLSDGEPAIGGITDALREAVKAYPQLQMNVAGPAGILADLFKVFGAIDTTLLGATALVVALILIFVYRSPFLWLIPLVAAGMALLAEPISQLAALYGGSFALRPLGVIEVIVLSSAGAFLGWLGAQLSVSLSLRKFD